MKNLVIKNPPNYFQHKGKFGSRNKNHSWQDATWDWVLRQKFHREGDQDTGGISLRPIHVYVWDQHDKPHNPDLKQEFTPDKDGTRAAHAYARYVVEEHGALLAEVDTRANLPGQYDAPVEMTSYELGDLSATQP